jgi:gliding motility-associated-like protein
MKYTLSVIFLFLGTLFFFPAHGQDWLWTRGNTGGGMDGWPVATDPSGNVFVAGIAWGPNSVVFSPITIPFSTSPAKIGLQCIMTKYDGNGNVQWARETKNGDTWLMSIATDPSGNSFMFGSVVSQSVDIGPFTLVNSVYPRAQYFLAKYDPNGNVIWARNAANVQGTGANIGNISAVLGTGGIATDGAGNIFITANFQLPTVSIGASTLTNTDPSSNTNDIFVAKYDPSGNVVWAKSFGGIANDEAYGITITHAGDIYIAGQFASPSVSFGPSTITNGSGNEVAFIARLDPSGNPLWAAGSGGNGREYAVGIASDISDNVYLTGGLLDNSISFSGTTITNPTPGKPVLYLVKFTPSNTVSWYKTIYDPGPGGLIDSAHGTQRGAWGYSIAMSQCGIIWVSGAMSDSVSIDGHILKEVPKDSMWLDPIFIAGYNVSGNYIGSAGLISGSDDQNGIACDPMGNVYLCSDYLSYLNFYAGPDTLRKGTNNEGEFMYVAKYPYVNSGGSDYRHTHKTECLANSIVLTAPPGYSHYVWSNGHSGASVTVSDTGVFWVYSFDSCTSTETDTFIIANNCECGKTFFCPNSFTPNGDGQNDIFYPRGGNDVKALISFRIYNRWGEMLFGRENMQPNDVSNAWDGTYKGDKPRPEVFVWVAEVLCIDGTIFTKKGSVTVIK